MTTPANPTTKPTRRAGVSLSSVVAKFATMIVNSGAVAFRIAARPRAMWVWPQNYRLNGSPLLMTANTAIGFQASIVLGID